MRPSPRCGRTGAPCRSSVRAMGFCLFNNAAVAAWHARAHWGLQRVAVADFDVHHGNGTQDIFAQEPGIVLRVEPSNAVLSGHRPSHLSTGLATSLIIGVGSGQRMGRRSAQSWDGVLLPALEAFAPELLIVSAGFDAHRADPLADLQVETADFAWITGPVDGGGRCALRREGSCQCLKGGYNLRALAASDGCAYARADADQRVNILFWRRPRVAVVELHGLDRRAGGRAEFALSRPVDRAGVSPRPPRMANSCWTSTAPAARRCKAS